MHLALTRQAPLMILPTEIRLQIYKYVFLHSGRRVLRILDGFDECRLGYQRLRLANIELLTVCRQSYNEALPVFYGCHIFHASSNSLTVRSGYSEIALAYPGSQNRFSSKLQLLVHLSLEYDPTRLYNVGRD